MDKTHLSLDIFPAEILLQICHQLSTPVDIVHLILCCRRFEALFLTHLHRNDVECWNSSALLWACRTGSTVTAQRSLDAGTSVNHDFWEAGRQPREPLTWPTSQINKAVSVPTPSRPLSVAVRSRQKEMVAFLVAQGADTNLPDNIRQVCSHNQWFPIHWALSCRPWCGNPSSSAPSCDRIPVDTEIVDMLLKHGANPNQLTIVRCPTNFQADHYEANCALHMSLCEHTPASAVRLLLEAGADARTQDWRFGCPGPRSLSFSRLSPFGFLGPRFAHQSENCDRKMILLAQQTGETRRWKFDHDTVVSMMARLTPCRMQLLHIMTEDDPQMSLSGVPALLKVWRRQKRAVIDAKGEEEKSSQAQLLRSFEEIVEKLLAARNIVDLENEVASEAAQIDLVQAFLRLC